MKLSFKFFCIAYIVVLLTTGIGSACLIKSITDTLWNTRADNVNTAVNYALDSFTAIADTAYGDISESNKSYVVSQIKNTVGAAVSDIDIYTQKAVSDKYLNLKDNECLLTFVKDGGETFMKSACRLNTGIDVYYIVIYSDFTETVKQCDLFWRMGGIAVFVISVISGMLLFAVARRITRPLKELTEISDEIALGNYGVKVKTSKSDYEMAALSESFNSMSSAIEEKISEINEELKKRDMFVADFTHEMKTPMTAIMGYAQMLRSYELDETEKMQAADAIFGEAKRLEKLSLQLLELYIYKNEEIETEKISLSDIKSQLDLTLKSLSEKYGVKYSINFGEETVTANGVLLMSLLCNLADNAFKASKPETAMCIYSESHFDKVRICVKDEGTGIEKEHIKLLTEPFYREDKSRSRKLGGAGLGLSLCKEIARLHETQLFIESQKGKGTVVSFELKKAGGEDE